MTDHRDASSAVRTQPVRASQASSHGEPHAAREDFCEGNLAIDRPVRAAETSRAGRPSRAPLAVGGEARIWGADLLDAVLSEQWERGNDAVSNRALADRDLRVDEKQVRQYRDGRKLLPFAALKVLPRVVVAELLARVSAELGLGERDASAMLRKGVSLLRKNITRTNAAELRAIVRDLQRQLLEVDARIDEVSR